MCYHYNRKTKKEKFICMPCLYLAVHTPKEVVLLKHYVLKRDWHPATTKFIHSIREIH